MKTKLKRWELNAYQGIVGGSNGMFGEGSVQWYYISSLVINLMLTWWLVPQLGIVFTIMMVLHCTMMYLYELLSISEQKPLYSVLYFASHLLMFLICWGVNVWWTLLTTLIVVIALTIAPDCGGYNILLNACNGRNSKKNYLITLPQLILPKKVVDFFREDNPKRALFFHTIWFCTFVIIALCLPISIWLRLGIIVICMALHPLIDFKEGDCYDILNITNDALGKTLKLIQHYYHRYYEGMECDDDSNATNSSDNLNESESKTDL